VCWHGYAARIGCTIQVLADQSASCSCQDDLPIRYTLYLTASGTPGNDSIGLSFVHFIINGFLSCKTLFCQVIDDCLCDIVPDLREDYLNSGFGNQVAQRMFELRKDEFSIRSYSSIPDPW
jgi:hypothetical protein